MLASSNQRTPVFFPRESKVEKQRRTLLGFRFAKTGRIAAKKKNKYATICLSERRKIEVHGAKDKTIMGMEEDGKAR